MKERRWDIVLRVVTGPLASRDAVAYRGPQVVVGTEPGPGGVVLPGGRGVAPRHCTLAAYDPHTMFVTPIGHNPVRVAPYAEVSWDQLEPIRGQVRLERGMAVHLGPTGQRGTTLEFVECRDLGLQTVVRLASEAAAEDLPRPPDAIAAKGRLAVTELLADAVPSKRYQAALAFLLIGAGVMLLAALIVVLVRLGDHGDVEREPVSWRDLELDLPAVPAVHQGWEAPLWEFVGWHNQSKSSFGRGEDPRGLAFDEPDQWDRRFLGAAEALARRTAAAGHLFTRLERVRDEYARVLELVRAEGLPDVFAAIPMVESCYRRDAVSPCCAKGYWQWMLEGGPRFSAELGPAYAVSGCSYDGGGGAYAVQRKTPVRSACDPVDPQAPYVEPGPRAPVCRVTRCSQDFRTDLTLSTRASLAALKEAYDDPVLAASGAAVQIAIASHNAGYDDRRFLDAAERKQGKPMNLLMAYQRWKAQRPDTVPTSHFYGDAMRCVTPGAEGCQAFMMAETQRYAPAVVADHLLAVCYYGRYDGGHAVFSRWREFAEDPASYCRDLPIPDPTVTTNAVLEGDACH